MGDYAYFDAAYNQGWIARESRVQYKGNEWDKNSPVWTNKQYLSDIYNELKRNFLKEQQRHSRVLVYDWSEPGDMEIVVEDIEALNFDFLEETDEQQKDWRLGTEERFAMMRQKYCRADNRERL